MIWAAPASERMAWCAPTVRASSSVLFEVDSDDLRGGRGPGDLDADVTEAADADQHDGGVRGQLRPGPTDGVVGRQAGVGERCGGDRIQAIRQRDQMSWVWYQQVVRHPAVGTQPAAVDG